MNEPRFCKVLPKKNAPFKYHLSAYISIANERIKLLWATFKVVMIRFYIIDKKHVHVYYRPDYEMLRLCLYGKLTVGGAKILKCAILLYTGYFLN